MAWQPGHRISRAKTLSLMYSLGGFMCLSILLRSGLPDAWVRFCALSGVAGMTLAGALFLRRNSVRWWQLQALTVVFALMIGLLAAGSHTGVGILGLGPAVIGAALSNAYYCTRRELGWQLLWGVGSFAVGAALAVPGDIGIGVSTVLLVAVTVGLVMSRLTEKLRLAGSTDALTGALNRATWQLIVARHLTDPAAQPLTVAIIDLDDFKQVNDVEGHLAGDALLRSLAQGWRRELGDRGILGRFGGDEFVILMADTDGDQALAVIDDLHAVHPAGWSHGLAAARLGEPLTDLLERADLALLEAKRARHGGQQIPDGADRTPPAELGPADHREGPVEHQDPAPLLPTQRRRQPSRVRVR